MNIAIVSNNPQEGDDLKQELKKQAPAIRIDSILNSQNAFAYLSTSSACDAILLDASVSVTDAVNLVSAIRLTKKSMGIVALVGSEEENPPTELIRAGADKLITNNPGAVSLLGEALRKAIEQHQAESAPAAKPARIIYAGDTQAIQPYLSRHPHWKLEPVAFAPDGLLELPEIESAQDEVIVIDCAVSGKRTLKAIEDIKRRTPDTPVILLTEPEDEEISAPAMGAGASDSVVKTGSYIQSLLSSLEREIKHRQLIREKAELQSREESLRQVIESMPVGIAVISPDGTFLAINHAGLKLLGAGRLDQIIGKSIVRLLPSEERDKIISFLAAINQGTDTSVQLDWRGLDGTISGTEFRAVPMHRDPAGTVVALTVITSNPEGRNDQHYQEDAKKEIAALKISLQESEARYRELQDKDNSEALDWEEKLRKAQSDQAAAEEQLAILRKTAEETEARYARLIEEQLAERMSWEQARESYKEQCAKIEHMAQALRAAQETLIESHDAERTEWESKLQELEHKKKDAEIQLTQISEESRRERSRWEVARQASEQKLRAAEEKRSMLDTVLQETQSGLVQLEENFSAERSEWDLARQEWERKLQAMEQKHSEELQSVLSDAESRMAAIQEENRVRSNQLEEAQREIERLNADRQKLTADLRQTHLRYQRLSQVTTVGFVIATRDGRVLECNDAAARMFGYAGAEEALASSEDDEFRIYAFEGVLDARLQQEGRLDNIEWSSLGRDGRLVRFQENARHVKAAEGESPLVERILTDITRIHRLGEEIRRTHRLESTGDLAAATVRSLKGLCASLENCGKLLLETPDDAVAVKQTAETLLKNVHRGIKHSRQFLSIAVKAEKIPGLINLNEILTQNDHLLRSLAGEDIDLQINLSPHMGLATADQQEVIQLISSLVASSREALPLGGTVAIETANTEIDTSTAGYPAEARTGTYVQMTISADGCVVHPERRIASNRMIVERLGGWMETANNAECGNLHKIYLPRVEQFGRQAKS